MFNIHNTTLKCNKRVPGFEPGQILRHGKAACYQLHHTRECLIADDGFEPPNRGVRVLCLTAWRIGIVRWIDRPRPGNLWRHKPELYQLSYHPHIRRGYRIRTCGTEVLHVSTVAQ